MNKQDIYNNAFNLLYKEMLVNSKLTSVANPMLNGNHIVGYSVLYAIKINDSAMVYDSIDEISHDGIDALFKSLENNMNLIHGFKEINIKYLARWCDNDGNYIYDLNNDYLNVIINDVNDLKDIKDCFKVYIGLKDNSKVFSTNKDTKVMTK